MWELPSPDCKTRKTSAFSPETIVDKPPLHGNRLVFLRLLFLEHWVAVKELKLSYQKPETILITIYPC